MLPAFISWDSNKELYKEINPEKNEENFEKPEIFGDNWSDDLDNIDKEDLKVTSQNSIK